MGFPWRNWTILPFWPVPLRYFVLLVHYTYYTLCLLWHVIHDNIGDTMGDTIFTSESCIGYSIH